YLPSGNILVSDINNGLFVFKDNSVLGEFVESITPPPPPPVTPTPPPPAESGGGGGSTGPVTLLLLFMIYVMRYRRKI
ncbi:MAG: GlyGly-CTERM sorting domain-containing protein, partial [Gammaproteobacteria bacterium]|nr:GlyGly-CTERM sorting domain-containing protein [Gammaproteobacteria bacterium]